MEARLEQNYHEARYARLLLRSTSTLAQGQKATPQTKEAERSRATFYERPSSIKRHLVCVVDRMPMESRS